MKKYLLLLFLILSYSSFSQKIKAIGIDVGTNICPLITRFQGFTGSLAIQVSDSTNNTIEYTVGYSSFTRPKNKIFSPTLQGNFEQDNKGFYFSVGKTNKKNFGWHSILSIYQIQNTLFLLDNDFNTVYKNEFEKELLIAIGADIFYEVPIKFNKKIQNNVRMCLSASIGTTTKTAAVVLYAPGFNLLTPRIILPTFGFGLSIPIFLNLK